MTPPTNPYQAWLGRRRFLAGVADDLMVYGGIMLACVVLAEGALPLLPWQPHDPQPWFVRAPVAALVIAGTLLRVVVSWVDGRKYRRQIAIEKTELRRQRQEEERRPVEFTDPGVLTTGVTEGWAEAETDPTRIDWPERQAEALIPFQVVDGRPVSPGPQAAVRRGRNGLGRWGENPMADALVTATLAGVRHVLLVERGDGHGWAVPGGSIDPGEVPLEAAARELTEETGLGLARSFWRVGAPRYVPDPRGSEEAWAVTVVARADMGELERLPEVSGADDARRAAWVPADTYDGLVAALADQYDGAVFPAHTALLAEALATHPEGADR